MVPPCRHPTLPALQRITSCVCCLGPAVNGTSLLLFQLSGHFAVIIFEGETLSARDPQREAASEEIRGLQMKWV